jgi:predicted Zn-dependent protease
MLGLCEFELHKNHQALLNLQAAARLGVLNEPNLHRVTLYHLALLQMRARRFGDAQQSLTSLMQAGAESEEVQLLFGEAALLIPPADAPKEGTPGRGVLLRAGKAEILKARKQFDAAKQEYLSLGAEYPDYPNLHFAIGRFLLDANEPDGAIGQFQEELRANPRNVAALLEIAAARYQTDSTDGARYAEEAVKINPRHPFAHYLLGLLYLDTRDIEGAIAQLEVARRGFPNQPEVYFALGNAYARAGRKEEAAQARSVFRRLQAQKENEPGPTVYGQEPRGVPPEKLVPTGKENPCEQP